ncbi:unnamed protein product [Sphagnum balticum]
MRRAFADIVKSGRIGLVLFLLGASWHEAPGLQLSSYGPSPHHNADYASRLKNKLSALEHVSTETSDFQVKPLVRFSAEEMGLPTMVLKMHKRYRMPRLQLETFGQIVHFLREYLEETGSELERSLS